MSAIEELKNILENPQGFGSVWSLENLANILLNEVQIKKRQNIYRIICAELYLYNEKHPDPAVYERNCSAGMWYFHNSGVDISFKSFNEKCNDKITKNSYFGGILVRGIEPINSKNTDKNIKDNPLNVLDELFDAFSAFEISTNEFPKIVDREISGNEEILYETRKNITADKLNKRKEKFELCGKAEKFANKEYKFFIKSEKLNF